VIRGWQSSNSQSLLFFVHCLQEQEGSLRYRGSADSKAALTASYESERDDEEPEDNRLEVRLTSTLVHWQLVKCSVVVALQSRLEARLTFITLDSTVKLMQIIYLCTCIDRSQEHR
jgi:hypothetical protein